MASNRSYWSLLEAVVLAYSTEQSGHIWWVCLLLLASISHETLESLFAMLHLDFLILDRALRFSMVPFGPVFIVFKRGELILMISETSFGSVGFNSLSFNFSTAQVMTSAVSIAEPLLLIYDSNFCLFDPFVCSFDLY